MIHSLQLDKAGKVTGRDRGNERVVSRKPKPSDRSRICIKQ